MSWEDKFVSWGKPPSKTEKERMENAEAAVRKAIAADSVLSKMDLTIFPQGSYKARTNIAQDSDVDICVRLNSTFFPHYPAGKTKEDYGNVDGSISFSRYKGLIHEALESYFGSKNVTRGNKAFDIHSNSYRVDADVVPTFAYKHYDGNGREDYVKPLGVGFDPDKGKRIINWPQQSYDNGVQKQKDTGLRYKKIIRILKRLRNEMQEEKIIAANDVASFLIESLVWNVPNDGFNHETYTEDVRYVLAHAFNNTINDEQCAEWGEVNECKYLFRSAQPWTRDQAHDFLSAAWDYIGFK